jgi:hypothetical protein
LGRGKTGGGIRDTSSWEVDSTKNTKIPRRNQGISTKGSWATLTVVLEKRRVKKSEGVRRVKSVWVYEPMKIRQSSLWNRIVQFCLNRQNSLKKLRPFQDNLRTRIGLKQEIKIHFKDKAHLGWEILRKRIFIWTTMRILLSPWSLGPTLWIGILEDEDLEDRDEEVLRRYNLDLLDKIFVAWAPSKNW